MCKSIQFLKITKKKKKVLPSDLSLQNLVSLVYLLATILEQDSDPFLFSPYQVRLEVFPAWHHRDQYEPFLCTK